MTTDSDQPGLLGQTVDYKLAGGGYFKDKTVCIVDHGLFTHLATSLAQSFGRTLYFSHWQQAFPRQNSVLPGEGLEGVNRIDHIWPYIDDIDLFVFPDIMDGPLQVYLRDKLRKRVWGSGLAEKLETERGLSKYWIRDLGLPVGPYKTLRGMNELRRHLQRNDDQYVKISRFRGDMETFHSASYDLIEPRLDELEHTLGAKKVFTEFVVEQPIESQAEVGYDGFSVDGKFPGEALFGVETKDAGYVGQVMLYRDMPRPVRFVNQKLAPLFKDLNYRGFWSSEIRVAPDGTPYLIDPCCRAASPPSELYVFLIENLAEIIWEGSVGIMVEPRWKHPYGAELIIRSGWAETGWQPIDYDPSLANHIKLHYHTRIADKNYYVPQQIAMPEIGAVVAGGKTQAEAIKNVTQIAEQIKGYDIKFDVSALEKAAEDMGKLAA